MKKKILLLLAAIVVAFPFSAFAAERNTSNLEILADKDKQFALKSEVYTTERVNIRFTPEILDDNIYFTADTNTKLVKGYDDDGWSEVLISGKTYYISKEYITEDIPTEEADDLLTQMINAEARPEESVVQPQVQFVDTSALRTLSCIIWAEAGNQCEAGQQAVGIVVMNRVRTPAFPGTVDEVIFQPGQFTPLTNGYFYTAIAMYDSGTLPASCIAAAQYALSGATVVNYYGNYIDMSPYLYFNTHPTGYLVQIQDHYFH